jgi:hypothetical protein
LENLGTDLQRTPCPNFELNVSTALLKTHGNSI